MESKKMINEDAALIDTMILLATYNGEKYLEEQLESLLSQTYREFVCYIHDDKSSDKTCEIIDSYCKKYPDIFVRWTYDGRHGAVGNFMSMIQYAAKNCNEKYVLFCDQDDVWLPDKVECEVNRLKELEQKNSSTPILVYCDQKLVDSELKVFAESSMKYLNYTRANEKFKSLVFENCAAGCVIAINRKLLLMGASFELWDSIVMHDWWVMLIASVYGKIDYIDKALMLYRQHGNNTLGAERKTLGVKIKKYLYNFQKSVVMKRNHMKKCENQIQELRKLSVAYGGNRDVEECSKICGKQKLVRVYEFYMRKYVDIKNWFTLLFV